MDRFAAMEAFVAVVEAGSFVAASERLGVSTTSVSRLVSTLEAHLDARLLHRTTRRLNLTDAGRSFYQDATALLADLAEAEAAVSADNRAASGLLRVSAPVSFGILHLGGLLARFRQEQPNVSLDLSLNDRVVDLVEEGHDLAIRISGQLRTSSLVARPLAPVRMVVCAAPAYLERYGVPQVPEDLAHHQCLLYSYAEQPDQWSFSGPHGLRQVSVNGFLTANNGDVLRVAALAGEGIVSQPSFIVGDDLLSGRLVPLLEDYAAPPLTVYAVYPSRRHLAAKVRAFVDFLAGAWGDPPPWDNWITTRDYGG
ncbi:MAG TPA: LysR family transcriptional regulator [Gammaproteobacteria bacterium]|nr:LysR family transcriptional regulator [Gammaproteobacteria bacterium]